MVPKGFEYASSQANIHDKFHEAIMVVDQSGKRHSLVLNNTLILVVWKVSGRNCPTEEFLKKHPDQKEQALWKVTNGSGTGGLAGIINWKTDPFQCPVNYDLKY